MATSKKPVPGPSEGRREEVRPDQRALTKSQAARLAAQTDLPAEHLAGRNIATLATELEFRIDPQLLLFRRICGRVVRTDSTTGEDWPVPGATVHVWDTDVNLFGWFPDGWPFGWFLPWGWRREEIGHAVTDACGHFCVWVPRFDIDWVLRWRIERRCFLDTFRRPSIRDLLDRLREVVEIPPHIGPWPEPGPLDFLKGGIRSDDVLTNAVGASVGSQLLAAEAASFGHRMASDELLDRLAFPASMPPPDPSHLRDLVASHVQQVPSAQRGALQARLDSAPHAFRAVWQGPFLRCVDTVVPTLVPVFDVPDISFSVSQDVDGDGVEETIYDESLFDVRWDAGPIPPVTLHAAAFAFATPTCGDRPDLGPCAQPELVVVGHMPLKNPAGAGTFPIVDTATGYAVRPNRPHASGRPEEVVAGAVAATAPLTGLLEFWGCNHHTVKGATASHYRILMRQSTDGGATFGPSQPILDSWMNWRVVGSPSILDWKAMTQLPGGWWEVLNPADQWIPGDHYLLQWHGAPDGLLELTLELGTASGGGVNPLGQAAPVRVRVDNSGAHAAITSLAWRVQGSSAWTPLPLNCPTIRRAGQPVEVKVGIHGWATHLRSLAVGASGCGSGNPTLVEGLEDLESGVPAGARRGGYWHRSALDDNVVDDVEFAVPASADSGAYSVSVWAYSRAFNPGDGHVFDPNQPDLGYDPAPNWTSASIGIAIVD